MAIFEGVSQPRAHGSSPSQIAKWRTAAHAAFQQTLGCTELVQGSGSILEPTAVSSMAQRATMQGTYGASKALVGCVMPIVLALITDYVGGEIALGVCAFSSFVGFLFSVPLRKRFGAPMIVECSEARMARARTSVSAF